MKKEEKIELSETNSGYFICVWWIHYLKLLTKLIMDEANPNE